MKKCLLCLLALLPLAGCESLPFARELEETMLVQVLGVDWNSGGVTLTAASDPGEGGENGGTAVLSVSEDDLGLAKAALKGAGEEYVSLTHVAQLIIGADTGVRDVLEAALEDPALGQGATVWLAESGAKELMEGAGGGAKRLSSIELNNGLRPITVLQSLSRLEEDGRVELPVLALEGETLRPAGSKIIREEVHGT